MDKTETLNALEALRAAIESQASPEIDENKIKEIAGALMNDKFAAALPALLEQCGTVAKNAAAGAVSDGIACAVAEVDEKIESLRASMVRRVEIVNGNAPAVDVGVQHYNFPLLLRLCSSRDASGFVPPIYLYGPAGTGKTTAAANVARALGLPLYFNGSIDSEYKLSGFVDAGGVFRSRPFFEAYKNGGVYLFDELDSSLPGAVLAFNSALANGFADFPCGRVERHRDCIILAAGNSCMRGDGAENGFDRIRQDGSFRDRFAFMSWGIDFVLEASMIGAPVPSIWSNQAIELHEPIEWTSERAARWLEIVTDCRINALANHVLDFEITPRASKNGMVYLSNGIPIKLVIDLVLRKGIGQNEWDQVSKGVDFDFK